MESLRTHIVVDKMHQPVLAEMLKPLKNLQLTYLSSPDALNFSASRKDADLTIIWVDKLAIRNRNSILFSNLWAARQENTILVSDQMDGALVLKLGAAGHSHFFLLPGEKENFVDEILRVSGSRNLRTAISSETPSIDATIIGNSISVTSLKNLVKKIAPRDKLMVLLRGETGTGKGLVAKLLHQLSPRSEKPFIEINCTAIPESLVEAELFGHEKGAFTDAHKSRRGIFELAHGGTLFLDEIGYLRSDIQVKLLKVLEDKRFRRVGGEKDIQVDCRIIAGTSVNLEEKVNHGEFREDLYYRLNVFPVIVPPLRERGQDVIELAEHFREYFSREHGIRTLGFTELAIDWLIRGRWPGNIRELKHCVERAVIVSEDQRISESAVAWMEQPGSASEDKELNRQNIRLEENGFSIVVHIPEEGKDMDDIQRDVMEKVLEKTGGNRSEAARLLRISRSRLLRRITTDEITE